MMYGLLWTESPLITTEPCSWSRGTCCTANGLIGQGMIVDSQIATKFWLVFGILPGSDVKETITVAGVMLGIEMLTCESAGADANARSGCPAATIIPPPHSQ